MQYAENMKVLNHMANLFYAASNQGEVASFPEHITLMPLFRCNYQCRMCHEWTRGDQPDMPREVLDKIIEVLPFVRTLFVTGGEPLMNDDLEIIIRSAGDDCATKLFTTGAGLTEARARSLKEAGLLYVSVSLDHSDEAVHDRIRGCAGAYREALDAIRIFKSVGMHVSVSSVLGSDMLRDGSVPQFLAFLDSLGIHEAWLSEAKPSGEAFWNADAVMMEQDRLKLVQLQDIYNKKGGMTVNYLGHFEGKEHFGCNAGSKMVYVDAFGEVSPCVFTPITFGNVRQMPIREIFAEMKACFPPGGTCFANANWPLFKKYYRGSAPICREETLRLMAEASFSPMAEFSRRFYGRGGGDRAAEDRRGGGMS